MIPMTAREIAAAAGGTLYGEGMASAVSTDSRSIQPGCLFVPLIGERFDGHSYIDASLSAGAAGCLCARLPEIQRKDRFYILVPDTLLALKNLALAYRGRFCLPVVQITGSVGKTTTKEMAAAVLRRHGETLFTEGNLNNAIGVPLTLLRLSTEHWAAVVESGMDRLGEIRYAGEMIRPDIAVITNIGDVHVELLGSREGILRAKSEIFENLKADGTVILNGDDPLLNKLDLPFATLRCGYGENCQVHVSEVEDRGFGGVRCAVTTAKAVYHLEIPAFGTHMVYAAAMATAIGELLGLTEEEIIAGVADYQPTGSRLRLIHLSDNRVILDDCYNANPHAMTAMLQVLSKGERTVAIMGDMGELGEQAAQIHREMGALARDLGIGFVIAVGKNAKYMAEGASPLPAKWYPTVDDFLSDLPEEAFQPGTVTGVKASHFMHFERIVEALQNR